MNAEAGPRVYPGFIMFFKRKLLSALTALSALGLGAAQAQSTAPSTAERQLLARLNDLRTQGVTCPGRAQRLPAPALVHSPQHAQAARLQAAFMGQSGRVSHAGTGGSTPRVRAASTGIQATSVTEIIYLGSSADPEQAARWWLGSAVHCFWMTEERYTHAGASVIQGARGTAFVVVLSSEPR